MRGPRWNRGWQGAGWLNPFSRPRLSNDNPYSKNPCFRTLQVTRPDLPKTAIRKQKRRGPARGWRRLSAGTTTAPATAAIKFVHAPSASQRAASTICKSEPISTRRPVGPSRDAGAKTTRLAGRQPEEVWINSHQKSQNRNPGAPSARQPE